MQSFKGDKKQLEGDFFFNREPVELEQDRGNRLGARLLQ